MDAFLAQLWIARWPLFDGFLLTIGISVAAIVLGTLVGAVVGISLVFAPKLARLPFVVYVDVMRGTPVLVLILAAFYIPAVLGLSLSATQAGVLALALFAGAHIGELLRGALQAIPPGQAEAGRAIGLTFPQLLAHVLLPQAVRMALPPWINTGVELIKGSSLLSMIGVGELLLRTQEVIGRNFMTIQFYVFAGLAYLLVNVVLDTIGRTIERRLGTR
ncbi:amino acid ABC transporter permease [Prosthecomicrobium pneumaticum]|uniref:Polar amino acid transport system permease protein n=1 Tax=Prosthecomicrobium pneumaticum TaxID=81895 RepID=A0A7W9CWL0_9HYPH|nr:amino acid ABC transporter permease [Prosthecomicrobium pneumaticum]MBB5752732.1 polar amino acid transport system permease protein [Prosthecomicrobium pneumaticum]